MKSPNDPDEVDDLATLEVLDEVRRSKLSRMSSWNEGMTYATVHLNDKQEESGGFHGREPPL